MRDVAAAACTEDAIVTLATTMDLSLYIPQRSTVHCLDLDCADAKAGAEADAVDHRRGQVDDENINSNTPFKTPF